MLHMQMMNSDDCTGCSSFFRVIFNVFPTEFPCKQTSVRKCWGRVSLKLPARPEVSLLGTARGQTAELRQPHAGGQRKAPEDLPQKQDGTELPWQASWWPCVKQSRLSIKHKRTDQSWLNTIQHCVFESISALIMPLCLSHPFLCL